MSLDDYCAKYHSVFRQEFATRDIYDLESLARHYSAGELERGSEFTWVHWLLGHATLEFVLSQDRDLFLSRMASIAQIALPLLQEAIARRADLNRNGYDFPAFCELRLAFFSPIYCAIERTEVASEYCRKTDYGEFTGKPKLDSKPACMMRIVRSVYLDQLDRLRFELESLLRMGSDPGGDMGSYYYPRKKLHNLVVHSFLSDEPKQFFQDIRKLNIWRKRECFDRTIPSRASWRTSTLCPITPFLIRKAKWTIPYDHVDWLVTSPMYALILDRRETDGK